MFCLLLRLTRKLTENLEFDIVNSDFIIAVLICSFLGLMRDGESSNWVTDRRRLKAPWLMA